MDMKKVLIVEDEEALATALESQLNTHGYEAKAVFSAKEGLQEIETSPYDLILLDLVMPSMNGFEFLNEIRKNDTTIPVVVITNLSSTEDILKAKEAGANDVLIKSEMTLNEVTATVQKNLK